MAAMARLRICNYTRFGTHYHAAHFGGRQDGYDQSDLPDVIILMKVIVSLFCIKMIIKYITKYSNNCKAYMY